MSIEHAPLPQRLPAEVMAVTDHIPPVLLKKYIAYARSVGREVVKWRLVRSGPCATGVYL